MEEFCNYLKYELNRSSLTVEAYRRDIGEFRNWLGSNSLATDIKLMNADLQDMRLWLASLSRKGDSAVTIRRKAQSLRAYYRYLLKKGEIAKNPASSLILPKLPKRLPEIVKGYDVENALEEKSGSQSGNSFLKRRNVLIVEMLYSLGLRRAELVAIDDRDVDVSANEIKVTGKRSKQRVVPVPRILMDKIKEWQQIRNIELGRSEGESPLFRNAKGRISTSVVYHAVEEVLDGVPARKRTPHSLRHTFATEMLNGGADINTVKEFLGHASLSTTQIYTHMSFAEMKKAYASAHPRTSAKGKDSKDFLES